MEELHKIAQAYYQAAPENIKQSAKEFIERMDTNGDGNVKLHEFLAFTKKEGYVQMSNPHFFNDLIRNDSFGFWEGMTLYYIVQSGRPFCDGCGIFIKGMYFTCVKCFEDRKSFNICISCFGSGSYVHEHQGQFLDNFLLLEKSRKAKCKRCEASKKATTPQPSTVTGNEPSTVTSNELVPYNPDPLVSAGIIGATIVYAAATVVRMCSIM